MVASQIQDLEIALTYLKAGVRFLRLAGDPAHVAEDLMVLINATQLELAKNRMLREEAPRAAD